MKREFEDEPDFSLVLGGPLYRLYLRSRLARPPLELVHRRILALVVLTWLPPFLMSLFTGKLVSGVEMPFLFDAEVHTRLLVALPILIGSEVFVHQRVRIVVREFLERELVAVQDRAKFRDLVASAIRRRNSVAAEIIMLVVAVVGGHWVMNRYLTVGASNWCYLTGDAAGQISAAGYWYAGVSKAIVRFLLFRWYYRLFVWYRFLWRLRDVPLHLNHFHPDRAGGLGFLGESVFFFAPVLVAQSVVNAGVIGNRIWHAGSKFTDFEVEVIGATIFLAMLVLAPLCIFLPNLMIVRRTARREFGALASRYVNEFRHKWITGDHQKEQLLGSADIQSLADLENSFAVVSEMRLLPFHLGTVIRLIVLIILPMAPLILTMIPLQELIDRLIKLAV